MNPNIAREFFLLDLWEPNSGKDINRHILAILFTYLCSIRKTPGLCAYSFLYDRVNLAFHSIMHWHCIAGTSSRRDFYGTNFFFLSFPLSFITWIIPSCPSTKAGSWLQFSFTHYGSSYDFSAYATGSFLSRIRVCISLDAAHSIFVLLQFTIVSVDCDPQ